VTDQDLVAKFEDGTLPMACFHHEEHVRVAFLYLREYPVLDVLTRFPCALQRYAAAHGKNGLYHATISWAYIFIIRERIADGARPQTWEEFKQANPELFDAQNPILAKYYRKETLASAAARESFVMPDIWMHDAP
jgi:hypothetical protein